MFDPGQIEYCRLFGAVAGWFRDPDPGLTQIQCPTQHNNATKIGPAEVLDNAGKCRGGWRFLCNHMHFNVF